MMRPDVGSDQRPTRSRKSSAGDAPTTSLNRQKTFFLTRNPDQSHSSTRSRTSQLSDTLDGPLEKEISDNVSKQASGAEVSAGSHDGGNGTRRSTLKPNNPGHQSSARTTIYTSKLHVSSEAILGTSSRASPTSISSHASEDHSIDDATSQAVFSSDDEGEKEEISNIDDSAPQLIMPSINMPSRRPFTQRGRQLGRSKILVTGNQGSGRTSLIKSIVQLCEHIVHVDTIYNSGGPSQSMDGNNYLINEIYASTKPYPEWWSDVDDSRILRRRKSLGNSILERNICFADTSHSGKVDYTLAYIEQQFFNSISSINHPGSELRNLLSGRGGCQVDLVLYLVTQDSLNLDLERMRRISALTNVVPLIAKSDLLSVDQLTALASSINSSDYALPTLPAFCSKSEESSLLSPYRVSSANGLDFDNMDASLLMSPEYVQPLLSSDLATLVDQLFEPSVLDYLRHLSGKKLVAWYASNPKLTKPISSPSVRSVQPSNLDSPAPGSLSHSGFLNAAASEISLNTSNSFALAKVADHTQREEQLAQLRLCKWASELQLSLQRERERYENIAQSERALWLVQKMREEIHDGQIVPLQPHSTAVPFMSDGKKPTMYYTTTGGRYEVYDPLGLIRWQDVVRARGWVMLQVIGSFGVIGGVTVWLMKTFGWSNSLHQWVQGRSGKWYGSE